MRKQKDRRAYHGPACPKCDKALSEEQAQDGQHVCRTCKSAFVAVRLTPSPERQVVVTPVAATDNSTPCAVHQRNASVATCGRCGLFMCQLCRIDSDGLVVCPVCFERLANEGALPSARKTYRDYGRLSSHLALIGLLLVWPFGFIFGPFAVWTGIKGLRTLAQPGVRISRVRCWIAIIAGFGETALFLLVLGLVVWANGKTGRS